MKTQMGWLLALSLVVVTSPVWAQKADAEADKKAELISDLATAAQLAAFGRGELNELTGAAKDFRSPEALVAAGVIYARVHKATNGQTTNSGVEVTDADDKPVAAEGKAPSLMDDANGLFDEARAIATGDKAASLEKQIKAALAEGARGASGGPRVINRTIPSGKTHNLKIDFEPGQPARVTMRGTGTTQFEVVGQGGKVLWHSKGSWGFYNFMPSSKGDARHITVRVINKGGPPVAYSVATN